MLEYIKSILKLPYQAKWFIITEAFFGLGIAFWSINLNFHLEFGGYDKLQTGAILAIGPIATAIFSMVVGGLCDRIGFKPAMVAGCVLKGIGMMTIAFAGNYTAIIVGQLIIGLGDALVLSSEFPYLLSLVEEKHRNIVYNLLISNFMLFMMIGNILGGYLPDVIRFSRNPYLIIIVASGLSFVFLGILRSFIKNNAIIKSERKMYLRQFKSRKILIFLLYGMIGGCMFNILNSMINLIFRSNFSLSDGKIGIIYSVTNLGGLIATFLVPMILQKYRSTKVVPVIFTFIFINIVVLAFSPLGVFIVFWVTGGFLRVMLPGTVDSQMLQSIPFEQQGGYSGLRIFSNQIGLSFGAYIAGNILTFAGVTSLFLIAAVVCALLFVTYYAGCRKHLHSI